MNCTELMKTCPDGYICECLEPPSWSLVSMWEGLLLAGIVTLVLGILLIIVNRYINKK